MPRSDQRQFRLPQGVLTLTGAENNLVPDVLALALWAGTSPGWAEVVSSPAARVLAGDLADGSRGYFKRFELRDYRDRLKHLVRPSRAARASTHSKAMQADGFRTPEVLGVWELRRWGIVQASGLLTRAIEPSCSLREALHACDRPRRVHLLQSFAEELARLHEAGWHHADLRAGNVLVVDDGGWRFCYVDNEGNCQQQPLPDRLAIHNLMQVNMERTPISMTERLRFWRHYSRCRGLESGRGERICLAAREWTLRRWR